MRKIRTIAAALVLAMLTTATAGAQQAEQNAGADMSNMFDPNSWMNMMGMTGGVPGYGAMPAMPGAMPGALGGNPYQWMMMPGNWVNPNMYMQFMNPNTYMAMMNPNNMMAMMNPRATSTVTRVTDQSGKFRLGRTVDATSITIQPAMA